MNQITHLQQILDLFSQSEEVQNNPQLLNNIHVVITQYCLPAQRVPQSLEHAKSNVILDIYSLFFRTLNKEPKGIDSDERHRCYKETIRIFRKWCKRQDWYSAIANTRSHTRCHYLGGGNYTQYCYERQHKQAKAPYSLKQHSWHATLKQEVDQLHRWLTTPEVQSRSTPAISKQTWLNRTKELGFFFGWLANILEYPTSSLKLEQVFDIKLLSSYIEWRINVRDNTYNSMRAILEASVSVAKFIAQDKKSAFDHDMTEVLHNLHMKRKEINLKIKAYHQKRNESIIEHIIPFEQGVDVVDFLKEELFLYDAKGRKRTLFGLISSWRKYLIVAILLYCPVRQREIRELELNRTIFRRQDGYEVVLTPDDHKTGAKTGKDRVYYLPKHLTEDLDYWINSLRPQVNLNHNFVFFKTGNSSKAKDFGEPAHGQTIRAVVTHATFRALDILGYEMKGVRPHDFRRIAVTFHRQHGDRTLDEPLAELMGHSVDFANRYYDLTTSREKTSKATNWWQTEPIKD